MTVAFPIFFAGLFGAMIGSFLNVCIYRLPFSHRLSGHALLAGRVALRCPGSKTFRSSATSYSAGAAARPAVDFMRYPFVEMLTAIMFAAAWWSMGRACSRSRLMLRGAR